MESVIPKSEEQFFTSPHVKVMLLFKAPTIESQEVKLKVLKNQTFAPKCLLDHKAIVT